MFFIYCGVINTQTFIYRTIHNKYPYVYIHISFLASTLYSLRPSSKMPTSTASTKTSTASTVVLKQDSWSSSISMTSANVASLIMPWHQQNKQNKACLTGAGPWSVLDIDNKTKTTTGFSGENGETGYLLVTEKRSFHQGEAIQHGSHPYKLPAAEILLGLDPINSGAKKSGIMFLNDAASLKKNKNNKKQPERRSRDGSLPKFLIFMICSEIEKV